MGRADLRDGLPKFDGDAIDQRTALTRYLLQAGSTQPIGEFRYSNAGFAVAMSMVERHRLALGGGGEVVAMFNRLEMDAGIGWPPEGDTWGHRLEGDRFVPVIRPGLPDRAVARRRRRCARDSGSLGGLVAREPGLDQRPELGAVVSLWSQLHGLLGHGDVAKTGWPERFRDRLGGSSFPFTGWTPVLPRASAHKRP